LKRFIFHVPVKQVIVCAIVARDEAEASRQLDTGVCEHLYTKPGTTASGGVELVAVEDIGDSSPKGDTNA